MPEIWPTAETMIGADGYPMTPYVVPGFVGVFWVSRSRRAEFLRKYSAHA